MKKITFLFLLLTVSLGYSQVNLEDFEGTAPTATNDQNIANSVEPNPDTANAVNISATALQLITTTAGEPWQGTKLLMQNNKIDMTTADKTMTVDIYSASPIEFLFKLSNGDADPAGTDTALESKTAMAHTGSGWETLTLDFNNAADTTQPGYNPPNDQFAAIVFFPLYSISGNGWNPSSVTTTYIDNVTAIAGDVIVVDTCTNGVMDGDETGVDCGGSCPDSCPSPPTGPPTAAPNRPLADVLSIFSDTYTDVTADERQSFGGAVITEIDFSGNSIISATTPVSGAGFQYQFFSGPLDLSEFPTMHFDFYFEGTDVSSVDTVFIVIVQDATTGNNIQTTMRIQDLTPSTWIEMDVPFVQFTSSLAGDTDRTNIGQVIIQSAGPEVFGPFYADNIYFHKNTLGTEDFASTEFKVYPNPTKNNWNIKSNTAISSITVYDILGKQVTTLAPNASDVEISTTNITSGIYFARIEGANGSKTVKLIKE